MKSEIEKILRKHTARDYGNAVSNNFVEPVEVIATAICEKVRERLEKIKEELDPYYDSTTIYRKIDNAIQAEIERLK